MPEHPEIRAFVGYFNAICKGVLFKDVFVFPCGESEYDLKKRPFISSPGNIKEFYIQSCQRGKQFRVDFYKTLEKNEIEKPVAENYIKDEIFVSTDEYAYEKTEDSSLDDYYKNENLIGSLVIGFGLTGYPFLASSLSNAKKNNAKLGFRSQTFFLCICAADIDSVYWRYGDFSYKRSPDIVFEYNAFRLNFYAKMKIVPPNINKLTQDEYDLYKEFIKKHENSLFGSLIVSNKCNNQHDVQEAIYYSIADYLLDQTLFNGVGNYLRSEILNKLKVYPLISFHDYIKQNKNNVDILLETVRDIANEAFEVINDEEEFTRWLKCYGVANNAIKDSNGRVIWFWGEIIDDKNKEYNFDSVLFNENDITNQSNFNHVLSSQKNIQTNYIQTSIPINNNFIEKLRSASSFQNALRFSQSK